MRVRTFFRNYMLIPVVLIPVFTFVLFFLTWQGGLRMSIDKSLLPLLFALPVAVSFLVIGIVVIVRLCRKLPVLMLVQVLVIEVIVVVAFFVMDYKRSTWMLNQFLYQDKREELVMRLQNNPNPGEEQDAMIYIDTLRNYPQRITLHGGEECLQNKRITDWQSKEPTSSVLVRRDCAGNLFVEFAYDGAFFGPDEIVLYSDKEPVSLIATEWDANGIPRRKEALMIDNYTVLNTLSPKWYYVRNASGFNLSFGPGGGSGGSGGGSAGGCP